MSAPVTGAGFCTCFQVDTVVAHLGSILSQADKTLGAGDRLARRGDSSLDRSTGLVDLMAVSKTEGRLDSAHIKCLHIDHGGTDPPNFACIASQAR